MTKVYRVNGKLAVNIPSRVRPRVFVYDETIEETVGSESFQPTLTWFPVLVRAYIEPNRTALLLTHDPSMSPIKVMETLGLDTSQPIEVRVYGSGKWLRAHVYHGRYVRVWIPEDVVKRTKMRKETFYPVLIRGMTHPFVKERIVEREQETILVNHLGNEYQAVKIGASWRWEIPNQIQYTPPGGRIRPLMLEPEKIFGWFVDGGGHVEAVEYIDEEERGTISFEIMVSPDSPRTEKRVSQTNGYAFRNIANRNYSLKDINLYPFFAELRASLLAAYPLVMYRRIGNNYENTLIDFLNITVWNMAGKVMLTLQGYPFLLSDKLDSNDIEYTPLYQRERYTREKLKFRKGRERLPDYVISEGTEINEKIDRLDFEYFPFGYCIKYCRIVNEKYGYYVYDNAEINKYARKLNTVLLDEKGFVWTA